MNCPGCGVNLMANMKECPKCHFVLGTDDGGTKHIIWKNQRQAYAEEEIRERAKKAKDQVKIEYETAIARTQVDEEYMDTALANLREFGADGYYEYSVKTVVDESGRTNVRNMIELLNKMGLAGWKLVSAHTNELGKNALMVAGLGINATAEETVLIFERYVKIRED